MNNKGYLEHCKNIYLANKAFIEYWTDSTIENAIRQISSLTEDELISEYIKQCEIVNQIADEHDSNRGQDPNTLKSLERRFKINIKYKWYLQDKIEELKLKKSKFRFISQS